MEVKWNRVKHFSPPICKGPGWLANAVHWWLTQCCKLESRHGHLHCDAQIQIQKMQIQTLYYRFKYRYRSLAKCISACQTIYNDEHVHWGAQLQIQMRKQIQIHCVTDSNTDKTVLQTASQPVRQFTMMSMCIAVHNYKYICKFKYKYKYTVLQIEIQTKSSLASLLYNLQWWALAPRALCCPDSRLWITICNHQLIATSNKQEKCPNKSIWMHLRFSQTVKPETHIHWKTCQTHLAVHHMRSVEWLFSLFCI